MLSGWEALVTFVLLPLLAALLVSIGLRRRHLAPRLIVVAYLTLAIPLFGISAGGANVLQQMLGGIIGGGKSTKKVQVFRANSCPFRKGENCCTIEPFIASTIVASV